MKKYELTKARLYRRLRIRILTKLNRERFEKRARESEGE